MGMSMIEVDRVLRWKRFEVFVDWTHELVG